MMNLSILLLIPFITALLLIFSRTVTQIRWVSLAGAVMQFGLSACLLFVFARARATGDTSVMLFMNDVSWFEDLHIHFTTGVDGISVAMIMLTSFVVLAGVLISWKITVMPKTYFILLIVLSAGAYGFFISLDLFMMFFFLELAVVPKFMLISIWGSGKNEYSAMKLVLMLTGGSALVFVSIMGLYLNSNGATHSFNLVDLSHTHLSITTQRLFFPMAFVGFGIFGALFPFHTWVPDGHSSAPTAASMFLAGISMKLGGYGCLRVATFLMPEAAQHYAPLIIILATIAIIYGAFATMMQTDLKYINAYSSVSHCGFVLFGIGMLTKTSITGAVMQMVSHGLMTALFFAAIGMIYSRTHTRMLSQLGGLLKVMPFISTAFVLAGLCSLGLPGLSGFAAEMTIFVGSWQNPERIYRFATVLACASIVVTAVYILRAVAQTIMGPLQNEGGNAAYQDADWNERLAIVVLIAGILVVGLAPFWLTDLVRPAATVILNKLLAGATY